MKKLLIAVATIFTMNFFVCSQNAEAAVAVGKAPINISNPAQARMSARRAAQVVAIKNNGGKAPQVISESWNSSTGEYTIQY